MRSGDAIADWADARLTYPRVWNKALGKYVTLCMRQVLDAADLIPIDGYDDANDGWRLAHNHQPGNRDLMRGQPAYFAGTYGHVVTGTGNGEETRGVDPYGSSAMVTMTIGRLLATGKVGSYRGSVTDFSGMPIHFSATATAAGNKTPIPTETENPIMRLITHPNGQPALVGESTFELVSAVQAADLNKLYGALVPVSSATWELLNRVALPAPLAVDLEKLASLVAGRIVLSDLIIAGTITGTARPEEKV